MEKKVEVKARHCLVLPYPAVGHVNPLRQLSKRLHHKGLTVTLVVTEFFRRTHRVVSDDSVSVETISDGHDQGGFDSAESVQAYLDRFWTVGPETLARLVGDLTRSNRGPVDCVVYDAFLPWGLHVARRLGISAAAFFTQSSAVNAVYYHVSKGSLGIPVKGVVALPGLVPLGVEDLPSFVSDEETTYPGFLSMVVDQFADVEGADWVLYNTILEIEHEAVDWTMKVLPLMRTVGPTLPSMLLDKRIEGDKHYETTLSNPETEATMERLNSHPNRSVIFVSFGSLVAVEAEQIEEVACGLRNLDLPFLWVVRSPEKDKLPKGFAEEFSSENNNNKGLVVSWCNQLEVLANDKIGCFVTHCGWNSTLEALSLGVPMVGLPQWSDQFTNAKHIADVWKVGVRGERDERGIVRREVLEKCVEGVMDGERAEEIRENATKLRELVKGAMSEGGSSDRNIDEFISSLDHGL